MRFHYLRLLNHQLFLLNLGFFFVFGLFSAHAWTLLLLLLLLILSLLALVVLLLLHLLEHVNALKFFLLLLDEALDLHIHVLNFVL